MRRLPSAAAATVLLAGFALLAACAPAEQRVLVVAPVSMQEAGFLDWVVPEYQAQTGVRLVVTQAANVFADEAAASAHVILSHDPASEQRLVDQGRVASYRKYMFNRFVLAGPPEDPADVRNATMITDAFRRIAASGATFVSRGDGSTTHAREVGLWRLADAITPATRQTGLGMGDTLREASRMRAYCLTLPSVFERYRTELAITPLFDRDEELLNTYAVMVMQGAPRAASQFAEWLALGEGRRWIERFKIGGRQAYSLWPVTAPAATPDALPNYTP